MTEKQIGIEKIKKYKLYIAALELEKESLQKVLEQPLIADYPKSKAQQRIFDIDTTIQGHKAFIIEYQNRLNPTTYRKNL